jgi:hypothetical protein
MVPVVLTAMLLGIGECALRSFAPIYLTGIQSAYEYDAELGYRLKPGIHQYLLTDNLQEIRTGPLGNVGYEDDFSRYPELVFALGDSYTQGTGNSADAAYPFQLDMLLNQDEEGLYRERFGIVNLGLAAFGTEQSLRAARRYAEIVGKPRYLLYLGCDNDFEDDEFFRNGYRHEHLVAGNPKWGRWVGPLLWIGDFELAKRARLALAGLRHPSASKRPAVATGNDASAPTVAERVWPTIAEIVELGHEWNATVVVSWANPDGGSYEWLEAKAAREGSAFADCIPAMRSVQARMPALNYANPHSAGHWRPWTNRIIAEAYARAMDVPPAPAPSAR